MVIDNPRRRDAVVLVDHLWIPVPSILDGDQSSAVVSELIGPRVGGYGELKPAG